MPGDFKTCQVVIAHQALWDTLVKLGEHAGLYLQQIPNGVDEDGQPVLNYPGDLPTYAFMPRTATP